MNAKILDSFGFPAFVCGENWTILHKNKAAMLNMKTPRKGTCLSRIFMAYESRSFVLSAKEKTKLIDIDCRYGYCKAVCFAYEDKAIVFFPDIFTFEALSYDYFSIVENMDARIFLNILKAEEMSDSLENRLLSKIKKEIYSSLDASFKEVRLYEPRPALYSLCSIYDLIKRNITSPLSKYGRRIQIDISLLPTDYSVYADAKKLSLIFMNFLIFGTKVSCDGKCSVKVSHFGDKVKNEFVFFLRDDITNGNNRKNTKLPVSTLMRFSPASYATFAVFEFACEKYGWNVGLYTDKNNGRICTLYFEAPTQDKYSDLFRSGITQEDAEKLIEYIIRKAAELI